jgi:cytochrome c
MGSFELNKIAGAALTALLFIFGAKELAVVMSHAKHDSHGASAGYTLPMPKGGSAKGGGAPAAQAFGFAQIAPLLAKANPDSGKDLFKACAQCHTVEKGGATKQGPNLYEIIGRDIGKHPGFSFSPALNEKGGKWTWETLANYLHDPKGYIPGNRMSYAGMKDNAELADMLVYLRTLSDKPADLPAAPAAPAAPAEAPKQ